MTTTVDVAIVGAGCTGLYLARYLRKKNRTCAILDEMPFGQYSSTKNQGWVHSGALYASKGQRDVALECSEAYEFFEAEHSDALHHRRSFYLFDNEKFQLASERLADLPIRFDPITDWSGVSEPILHRASRPHLVEVDDKPVDTNKVLSKVLDQARSSGVLVLPVPKPASLTFQRHGAS